MPCVCSSLSSRLSADVHVKRMLPCVFTGLPRELTGGFFKVLQLRASPLLCTVQAFNEDDTQLRLGYHDLSFSFTYCGIPSIQPPPPPPLPQNRFLQTASCPSSNALTFYVN